MISVSITPDMRHVRAEATLIRFFAWFAHTVIPRIQRAHFDRGRAAKISSLSIETVKRRARRQGWYGEASPESPATSYGPPGWWSGFTMAHTTPKRGRLTIRSGVMTLQTSLKRWWVGSWWNEKEIERHLEWSLNVWMQAVLEGKKPRPSMLRVAA